jgi:hypothetical protein
MIQVHDTLRLFCANFSGRRDAEHIQRIGCERNALVVLADISLSFCVTQQALDFIFVRLPLDVHPIHDFLKLLDVALTYGSLILRLRSGTDDKDGEGQ